MGRCSKGDGDDDRLKTYLPRSTSWPFVADDISAIMEMSVASFYIGIDSSFCLIVTQNQL